MMATKMTASTIESVPTDRALFAFIFPSVKLASDRQATGTLRQGEIRNVDQGLTDS
jgi:hypothetical protein